MVSRGFSLVEVIVAMALLSVGLLGISAAGLLAARLMNQAQLLEDATNRAASVMDSIAIHDLRGAGVIQDMPYRLEWTAADSIITVRAVLPHGAALELEGAR